MNINSEDQFFYLLCHFIFIFQVIFIYFIEDELFEYDSDNNPIKYKNYYLIVNKSMCYIIIFLCSLSHIRAAFANPGVITSRNNTFIIEFYYCLHKYLIKQAIKITKKQTPEVIRNVIFQANNIQYDPKANYALDKNDDFINNNSDEDDYKFTSNTSVTDEMKKSIIRNNRMKLTRCKSCYVVRPSNSHHCKLCHKCVLERDHHCPLILNCVGTFNRKFYILYIFYAFLSAIDSLAIFCYYTLYKNFWSFYEDSTYFFFSFVFVFVSIIYGLFTFSLIKEQIEHIKHDTSIVDYDNGILLESSSFKQQLIIIFGDTFSLKWLLPFYKGGNYDVYIQFDKEEGKQEKKEKKSGKKGKTKKKEK